MSTINLLPEDYMQRRSQHRANVICMGLFAIVIASVGGAALVSERTSRNTREVCERIQNAYAEAAKLIDEMHELEAQKHKMLRKAEMSAALMERLPRSYVLAMVTNALPKGTSLVSMQLTTHTTAAAPAGKPKTKHEAVANKRSVTSEISDAPRTQVSLVLNGQAVTDVQVARFIANLARTSLTELVDLVYSRETKTKEGTIREFKLAVRLKPNADALNAIQRVRKAVAESGKDAEASEGGGV